MDAKFSHVMVYLDGVWQANVTVNWYIATGLDPDTTYQLGTRTVNILGTVNPVWVNGTARTLTLPDVLPGSITNLQYANGTTWIRWSWTNPPDADFSHVEVYLNGLWQADVTNDWYLAKSLVPDTTYHLGTRTVDISGTVNPVWMNSTARTRLVPDEEPPGSITNLQYKNGTTWLNWSWTNPPDSDFSHVMVHMDSVWQANVTTPSNWYNATGLIQNTTYQLGARTVDFAGNVNKTWVSDTARTATPTPTYYLTTSSTAGGSVTTPGEATFTYDEGTVVDLVAIPDTGYQFVNWTGDVGTIANVNAAATTITMNNNYTITANFASDIEAPAISNVESTEIAQTTATITWDTDEPADSRVKYGTTSGVYTDEAYDGANVTSHSVELTSLTANTTYYYVVNSTDSSGNPAQSEEFNFTTLAVPAVSNWDINEDCTVNYIDLTILSAHWGETTTAPYPRYDINADGMVNYIDLTILSAHWDELTC